MKNFFKNLLPYFIATFIFAGVVSAQQAIYPQQGGTGTSTVPTTGEILVGQSDGTYAPQSTSTLGISSEWQDNGGELEPNEGEGIKVNYVTATATDATSTFAFDVDVNGNLDLANSIDFTPITAPLHKQGRLFYDTDNDVLSVYNAESDVTLNVGEEMWFVFRNETGSTITDGTAVYLTGGSSGNKSLIALARSDATTTAGVMGLTTHDIENNTNGYVTMFGTVRGLDTSAFTEGDKLFASSTSAGSLTNVSPTAPNFPIQIGQVTRSHATQGEISVSVGPSDVTNGMVIQDLTINNDLTVTGLSTFVSGFIASAASTITGVFTVIGDIFTGTKNLTEYADFRNGTFIEALDALVQSDATTASTTIEAAGGGDLTVSFSSGDSTLDCAPSKCVVQITTGSTTVPQSFYIYVLESDPTNIATSTSAFPSVEHAKIAFLFCQGVSDIQSAGGCLINQNWNDFAMNGANMGGWARAGEQRRYGKGYWSGLDPNGTDQSAGSSYFDYVSDTESYYKSTAGVMYQANRHAMPAIDTSGSDDIHIFNSSVSAYREISDFTDITLDSTGASLANSYWNICIFETGNKTGQHSPVIATIPAGSYSSQTGAENDTSSYDECDLPREFIHDSGVSVPVVRMTLRYTGGTAALTHISSKNLREGTAVSGGSGLGVTTFLGLTDTPSSYSSQALKVLRVNSGETTLEFASALLADGTVPLTANWNTGAFQISASGTVVTNSTTTNATSTSLFSTVGSFVNSVVSTLLTVLNVTVTGLLDIGAGVLEIPNGTNPTVDSVAECAFDTSTGQLICYNGSSVDVYFNEIPRAMGRIGSTSLDTSLSSFDTGTSTWAFGNWSASSTITSFFARTDKGTCIAQLGDGTASTSAYSVTTTSVASTSLINNTFIEYEEPLVAIGSCTSSPNYVTPTPMMSETRQ